MVKHKSLAEERPDLLNEWDYEENDKLGIKPDKITCGSGKKVYWKCNKGHKWEEFIYNRIRKGFNCPFCSSHRVLEGYNDLKTLRPDLANEWNYEKNKGLLPTQVALGSGRKVWWKCSKGHEWQSVILSRKNGCGCPKCSADLKTSFPEQAIYYFLDMYFHGLVKNRYKLKDKKGYIEADIYLPKMNTVIEYDGVYWHKNKQEKDLEKEFRFKAMGIKFIRIVEYDYNKVIDNYILYNYHKNRDKNLTWAIQELFDILNVSNLFVDVSVFRSEILEFSRTCEIENSLFVVNPKLAQEWNYKKNGILKPTMFTCGSHEKVWWKCLQCGNEWSASINLRNKGTGCPICGQQKSVKNRFTPKEGQSLQDKLPTLAKEWYYERNKDLLPSQVTCGSKRKVWWMCSVCGNIWATRIAHRVNGHGCRKCAMERKHKK